MKIRQAWPLVLTLAGLLFGIYAWAAGFNPGEYPGVYNSGATYLQSGVISTRPSNMVGCEFFNNTAATAFFMVYNSSTVSGQTVPLMVGWCFAGAGAGCSVGAAGPSGPMTNAAILAGNGLSWYGSSTFGTQTGIGANGHAICTFNQK